MTQTLLPFTFLNSTFSSFPLSMLFFLLKVFSNVKRLYFLKKNFPFLSAVSFSTSCCSVTLEAQTNLQYSQVLQADFSLDRMVRFDARREDISVTESSLIFSRESRTYGNFGGTKTVISDTSFSITWIWIWYFIHTITAVTLLQLFQPIFGCIKLSDSVHFHNTYANSILFTKSKFTKNYYVSLIHLLQ